MTERYSLHEAFRAKPVEETRALYDDWATTYERENLVKGYRLPWMGAAMLARYLPAASGAVLDAGCGTGLVGEALSVLGYGSIIGCDLSPGMMALARSREAYADLALQDMSQRFQWPDAQFAGFICIGCFGPAHAPAASLRQMVRVTRPGGIGVFSLLDVNLDARGFGTVMRDLTETGAWRVVERTRPFRPYITGEAELLTNLFAVEVLEAPT
ncbi:MAG: class I SAM-dependent methyltransferase [Tabrizicola sp.]|nr:class I SAM-dependent methyltransferase [Tabrizicola sp.]